MKEPYLEITFRRGKPVAAYYHLPGRPGRKSCRTVKARPGIVVDIAEGDEPMGLEITAPGTVTLAEINQVLQQYGIPELDQEEFAPLQVA